jgi:hypothetical protein
MLVTIRMWGGKSALRLCSSLCRDARAQLGDNAGLDTQRRPNSTRRIHECDDPLFLQTQAAPRAPS